jgi:HlyD family secretion protein
MPGAVPGMRNLTFMWLFYIIAAMKRILFGIIFLIIIAAGIIGYVKWAGPKSNEPVKVPSQSVTNRTVVSLLEETGTIQPRNEVVIKSEVNGRVDSLYVEDGDYVTSGYVLVELDKTDLNNQRREYELDLQQTKLNLEKAQLDYERNFELYEKQLVSSDVYDSMRIERDLKKNRVAKIETMINTIDDKLKKSTIIAPIRGTILNKGIEVGEVVIGASSVSSGTELMKIADLGLLEVSTRINEVDISSARTGMTVRITVDSIPGHVFTGMVDHIAPMAMKAQNEEVRTFEVTVLLHGDVEGLKPGMTANITMTLAAVTNAVVAPLASVFCDNVEAAPGVQEFYVFIDTATGYVKRTVSVGINDLKGIQVITGLDAEEAVAMERPTPKDEKRRQHSEFGGRRR